MAEQTLTSTRPPDAPRRAASRVDTNLVVALVAFVVMTGTIALFAKALYDLHASLGVGSTAKAIWGVVLAVPGVAALAGMGPAVNGVRHALRAGRLVQSGDLPEARVAAHDSRDSTLYVLGLVISAVILSGLLWFFATKDGVIRRTFFNGEVMQDFIPSLRAGLWFNIRLFIAAEILVLVFGLVVALMKMMPGKQGRPVRMIAGVYTDVFRGLPALVTIYLIVFGLPLADLPLLDTLERSTQLFWLCVIGIVLVYTAYVAEVYRAGLESIHWSQVAASRSLGLSQTKTFRHVVIPQAVRRIIPPLMNDFVALQKDTSLVSLIGVADLINRARSASSREASLAPYVAAGIAFLLITIPFTRLTDYLLERDHKRRSAGG
jgi:polar amino acid transport system permease protein